MQKIVPKPECWSRHMLYYNPPHLYTAIQPVGTTYGYWINEKDICSFTESQNRCTFEIHLGSHAGSAYSISFRFGLVLEDPEDYCECYTSGLHIPLEDMYMSPDHWIDSMSLLIPCIKILLLIPRFRPLHHIPKIHVTALFHPYSIPSKMGL